MRKFNLGIVVLISLISSGLITSAYPVILGSTKLGTQGSIDYTNGPIPQGFTLLYSRDFESVTGHGSCPYSSDTWVGSPLSNYGMSNGLDYNGVGTAYWMEGLEQNNGVPAHSGGRSFGQSMVNGYRNQFYTWQWDWSYSRYYYISFWRYFPSDFDISHNGGWWELGGFEDNYISAYPFVNLNIWKGSNGQEKLVIVWDNGLGYGSAYSNVINWNVPRNQWFKVGLYVDVGTADNYDASAKLYINDQLMISDSGKLLHESSNSGGYAGFGVGTMYSGDNGGYYRLNDKQWTDDVEIWGMPV